MNSYNEQVTPERKESMERLAKYMKAYVLTVATLLLAYGSDFHPTLSALS